ncbi:ABC transporter permease [Patescibacteria group bacterium]|nr:ABC transporter permease [Patescibacteria group bacterium]
MNSLSDVLVITQRNLIRYRRLPQLIIFSTVQPIMFLLLFNYVFGGAIQQTGTGNYINFLLPGIIVQSVLFGASQASVGIATDMSSGLVDRLRSLPINRAAFISGRVLADTIRNIFVVSVMIGVGFLIGFRFEDGPISAFIAVALVVSFGFAFSWISVAIGLFVKNSEAAQPAGFIWIFPLVFASSIFVPVQTMPEWLQVFARNQPVTKITQAVRSFTAGGPHDALIPVLIWMSVITILFLGISVWLYRRSQ